MSLIGVRDADEIERGIAAFARGSNGGLIVTGSSPAAVRRETIIALAARHRLPAVYPFRFYASDGGLITYGPDAVDQFRRAAGYVDRILKGEKPADLPVQAPTKYELVINLFRQFSNSIVDAMGYGKIRQGARYGLGTAS